VPTERHDLLGLAGVGDYVADAVMCFAYGEPVAIVDTNTVRVAGRYFGFSVGPESRRSRAVKEAVSELLDRERPVESNLSLLDLAASVCRAGVPLCGSCPVLEMCDWARRNRFRQTAVGRSK
jgi:A/G-specific adenine glycosylase